MLKRAMYGSAGIDQKIGALEYEALALENLGEALEMVGKWDDAAKCYERCLTLEGFDEHRPSEPRAIRHLSSSWEHRHLDPTSAVTAAASTRERNASPVSGVAWPAPVT